MWAPTIRNCSMMSSTSDYARNVPRARLVDLSNEVINILWAEDLNTRKNCAEGSELLCWLKSVRGRQCHMIWSCFHSLMPRGWCRFIHSCDKFYFLGFIYATFLASRFPYLVHKVFLVERIHAHHGLLATCWTVVSSGIRWFCSRVYGCCETCIRREMPCSGN